jgi:hypothetical protein
LGLIQFGDTRWIKTICSSKPQHPIIETSLNYGSPVISLVISSFLSCLHAIAFAFHSWSRGGAGAIHGTHVPITISLEKQAPYRNRKLQ